MIVLPVLVLIGVAVGFFMAKALRRYGSIVRDILTGVVLFVAGVSAVFLVATTTNLGLARPIFVVSIIAGYIFFHWKNISGFFSTPNTFGSSRWATTEDVAGKDAFGTDGIRIGQFENAEGEMEWVSYKGDRHLLTVAPTRAGKGTTQIIPNLLTYEGSALVIDPKGENAFATAERRHQMGQEIHIVDPWVITPLDDLTVSEFNPLDWLDTRDPDLPENAMLLASALVVETNSKDPFWDEEAKALLQGLIMHVATDPEEDGQRHLSRVRELLVQDQNELDKTFAKMKKS